MCVPSVVCMRIYVFVCMGVCVSCLCVRLWFLTVNVLRVARDVVVMTRTAESFSIAMLSQTYNQVKYTFSISINYIQKPISCTLIPIKIDDGPYTRCTEVLLTCSRKLTNIFKIYFFSLCIYIYIFFFFLISFPRRTNASLRCL